MKLMPWYDVVKPREDLREGKPIDASEFAVHLDKVRLGTAPLDYRDAPRFFDRTYLTDNLAAMAAEVVRRLSGVTTETSAVFNMTTQFGGGKTHALTLLYHLAHEGPNANALRGVEKILQKAAIKSVPANTATAIFVGTEFDSIAGRGGNDGTPLRKTPWGEIAWQLGGAAAFAVVAQHDAEFVEPKGDVIDKFIPKDRPSLILMDEVLNYVSTYRERAHHNKLYNFIQALSEVIRGRTNAVLVGSIPASELSYTDRDHADQQRFKNLLDRVGKAVILSVETETSEIIRRRLFEWDDRAVAADGRVMLPKEAHDACKAYADWVQENRQQLPNLIHPDQAREQFLATYPLHPMTISVFERKWQTLPRFQQTRGVLRLLALWVSRAYQDGYKGAQKEPMISLGSAPLEDAMFRAAVFEQLGETKLEAAVTTDIVGKKDAHAVRLDAEAVDSIKASRLHRKAATTIFFESNGGQVGSEAKEASVAEIRLAVGEPGGEIGNVETVLEALTDTCYYLTVERTRYKFSLRENLNKRFADRRATVPAPSIDEEVRKEIQKVFATRDGVDRVFFPKITSEVADRPAVTFVIADLAHGMDDEKIARGFVEQVVRECGTTSRTFKSALIWVVPDSAQPMREEARKLLAWQAIFDERHDLKLDEVQERQLQENIQKAKRDLKEAVWRSYKHVLLLGKDNKVKSVDLGLVHSSSSDTPINNILNRLSTDGDVERGVAPNFLVRNWSGAFTEWSTRSLRDAFYSSPVFPRVLNVESVRDTIARGVSSGQLAYVTKKTGGGYSSFVYSQPMTSADVEISDDVFIITKETADKYLAERASATAVAKGNAVPIGAAPQPPTGAAPVPPAPQPAPKPVQAEMFTQLQWNGEVPPQKWMNFYTKVVSKYATTKGVKLTVKLDVSASEGIAPSKLDETKSALRELGLNADIVSDRKQG